MYLSVEVRFNYETMYPRDGIHEEPRSKISDDLIPLSRYMINFEVFSSVIIRYTYMYEVCPKSSWTNVIT